MIKFNSYGVKYARYHVFEMWQFLCVCVWVCVCVFAFIYVLCGVLESSREYHMHRAPTQWCFVPESYIGYMVELVYGVRIHLCVYMHCEYCMWCIRILYIGQYARIRAMTLTQKYPVLERYIDI